MGSDLEDIELDATMLHNKTLNRKSLENMRKKYYTYPGLVQEINKRIAELEERESNYEQKSRDDR